MIQLDVELRARGFDILSLHSAASNRLEYLLRPDLGRKLTVESRTLLMDSVTGMQDFDVAFVISDGLSALAVQQHAIPTLVLA